ncbi:MAG TPA: AIR synthase-related protein [Candidatus Methylomirabilis sp.]|nr:AIR synthase-related protein [Candidatus Methylomirabilis sp.]
MTRKPGGRAPRAVAGAGREVALPRPRGGRRFLPAGKLPAALLARLLRGIPARDPRVLVGPAVGEDAAVLAMGDRCLVLTLDPITFATDEIGYYVVTVNANDVAVRGAEPRWFGVALLLPEGQADGALAEALFAEVVAACEEIGVALIGGHTEVTAGLPRPIAIGVMVGEAPADRVIRTAGARIGDAVILTKGIAIEGTALLARECAPRLRARGYGEAFLARARGYLREPGIGVLRDARVAVAAAPVTAMHDPTEGGLATGLSELATAAGVGLRIEEEAIPILPEAATLCEEFGLDPLGTIASGALLVTCPEAAAADLVRALQENGILAGRIGQVVPAEEGVTLVRPGGAGPLPVFARDEIARVFAPGTEE